MPKLNELDDIIKTIQDGQDDKAVEIADLADLTIGERCYVALSTGRYDLLPDGLDPVEAWRRLNWSWQDRVARWRKWPEALAEHARMLSDTRKIIACCVRLGLHNSDEKDLPLGDAICQSIENLYETLQDYGRHDPGCSAEIDESKYPCKCGWKQKREQIFGVYEPAKQDTEPAYSACQVRGASSYHSAVS